MQQGTKPSLLMVLIVKYFYNLPLSYLGGGPICCMLGPRRIG